MNDPTMPCARSSHSSRAKNAITLVITLVLASLAGLTAPALAQEGTAITTEQAQAFWGSGGDHLTNLFMNQIFGPLFEPPGGGPSQNPIFPLAIGIFNVICLVVGGMLFFYNVVAGVVQTAHEGEVLGRRWSSLWAPVRVLIAVAMLTPLPGYSGYNTIQVLVAYMVEGSTRAASVLWSEIAGAMIEGQAPITGASPPLPVEAAEMAWSMQVCRAAAVKHLSNARIPGAGGTEPEAQIRFHGGANSSGAPYFEPIVPYSLDESLITRMAEVIDPPGWGSVTHLHEDILRKQFADIDEALIRPNQVPAKAFMTFPDPTMPRDIIEANKMNRATLCGVITTPPVPRPLELLGDTDLQQRFIDTHADAIAHALESLRKPAFEVVEAVSSGTPAPDVSAQIAAVTREMQSIVTTGLQGIITTAAETAAGTDDGAAQQRARDLMLRYISGGYSTPACQVGGSTESSDLPTCNANSGQAHGQGWIGAGTWYMMLARLNSENHQITNSKAASLGSPEFTNAVNEVAEATLPQGQRWVMFRSNAAHQAIEEAKAESQRYYAAGLRAWEDAMASLGAFGSEFPRTITGDLVDMEDGEGWLIRTSGIKEFAFNLANSFNPANLNADPMIGLIEAGNFITFWAQPIVAGAGVLQSLPLVSGAGGVINSAAVPLLAGGVLMSFILPMLPFVFWIVAVTGYFLLVAEAIIAVNLWAIAHLRMDGEGIAGEAGRQGYYLILALVLTPILMLFGFILGMAIFKVTTTLVNTGFYYMLSTMNTSSGTIWIIGSVVITIMIILVYIVLIERSFSLTMEFPSKILRWVGADAPLSAEEANRVRMAAAAATMTSGYAIGAAPSALGAAGKAGYHGAGAAKKGVDRLRPKSIGEG